MAVSKRLSDVCGLLILETIRNLRAQLVAGQKNLLWHHFTGVEEQVQKLVEMGFPEVLMRNTLEVSGGDEKSRS
ncbi:hypothetical protein F0562_023226 [Nyssa sinensis]|uniref:UBA domain-containing protein n=1 Tax=Nyssa sinensis TaxID=561372 RepID=A0A5J5BHE0_9ASTE|nr:hypothetical protein F0562_023226 [Nyssa sinensis]